MSEKNITFNGTSPRLFIDTPPRRPYLIPEKQVLMASDFLKKRSGSRRDTQNKKKNVIEYMILIFVLLLISPISAGDYKWHKPWPSKTMYSWQDVAIIDVVLDLGCYIHITNEDGIKVTQTSIDGSNPFLTYFGCIDTDVVTNFPVTISGTVNATSAAQGQWSAIFNGQNKLFLDTNVTSVQICIFGENVATHLLIKSQAQENVKVAELTIDLIPEVYQ